MFTSEVLKWDSSGGKLVLFIDKFPVQLEIKLIFMPPNTSFRSQRIDYVVTHPLKDYYGQGSINADVRGTLKIVSLFTINLTLMTFQYLHG